MAIVHYTEAKTITIGYRPERIKEGGQSSFIPAEFIVIMPGVNEIEDVTFEKIKNHPSFRARVKEGVILIISETKGFTDGKKSISEMQSLLSKTFDTKLLRKIIKEDGRDEVIKAAKGQLDKILSPSKDDKKEETDEHFS